MSTVVQDSLGGRPVQIGDGVRIVRGPFAGLYGTIAGLSGVKAVVIVIVSARKLHLEMNTGWMDATPQRRSASRVEDSGIQHRSGS
jgi:hypothetical protein